MSHYKSNLRDIEFNLFEVLRRQDVMGAEPYEEFDEETARGILDEVNRLAVGPLAESFVEADRHPPVFDPADGSVQLPESFRRSFRAYMDAEWYRLDLPAEIGGSQAPRSLYWAVAELILGSNPAVWMYSSGPAFAHLLWEIGTPEQKRFAVQAIERKWGSTMVLTEPDAGSDVGAWPDEGDRAAGRHVAHRGRQAVHHQRRAGHDREHLPPGAGAPRGRWARHQGAVDVPRAQVPGERGRLAG